MGPACWVSTNSYPHLLPGCTVHLTSVHPGFGWSDCRFVNLSMSGLQSSSSLCTTCVCS